MKILVLATTIAVSSDGESWVLVNAAPDLGRHLASVPLHPRPDDEGATIRAVVLTDARIEHAAGLLDLRESAGIELCAMPFVFEALTAGEPLIEALQRACGVRWHLLPVAGAQTRARFAIAAAPSLRFTAVAVTGDAADAQAPVGAGIALRVDDLAGGASLFHAPVPAALTAPEAREMRDADCVVMGAAAEAGDAALHALRALAARRKVLLHGAGPRRDVAGALGIELAHDGMEITL
jgi:pyrroloquinoline quinone biosynthesis protein B